MLCHCRAVTDRTVQATVLAGARDTDDVAARCGAGSRCGSCVPAILTVVEEHIARVDIDARTAAA
jgi:bacterioferritin-associated ferredoxin